MSVTYPRNHESTILLRRLWPCHSINMLLVWRLVRLPQTWLCIKSSSSRNIVGLPPSLLEKDAVQYFDLPSHGSMLLFLSEGFARLYNFYKFFLYHPDTHICVLDLKNCTRRPKIFPYCFPVSPTPPTNFTPEVVLKTFEEFCFAASGCTQFWEKCQIS